jgi:seryl-tRNA(Sec) selenium transferase
MKRRNLIKSLSLLPFTAALPSQLFGKSTSVTNVVENGDNIFRSLGVEPLINCRGTFTIIGGSIERPEVRAAMEAAAHNFVQYDELGDAVHAKIAEVTQAEWALVSAGCAAGMKHVTAACVTGGNPEKLICIPNLTGFEKTEVIIPAGSRNVYDHSIRNIGVTIIDVNTPEELVKAVNKKTAMIYIMADDPADNDAPLSLVNIVRLTKEQNIPILVDAAAEVLTIPNIHLQRGAHMVAYSGGKAICGPQCAGFVIGQKDILMSAWQASAPHHGPCRDNKVGREEMLGMLAAVQAWTTRDHQQEWKTWLSWLDLISKRVTKISGISTSVFEPVSYSNRSPVLRITWDPNKFNITGEEVAEEFGRNKPRIAVGSMSKDNFTGINITTGQMQPGEAEQVAERVYNFMSQTRTAKNNDLKAPAVSLTGTWKFDIQFFSSKSAHQITLTQDGNWLQGSHKGDFSTRECVGAIEGNEIKLKSQERQAADNLTYIFSGTVSGETMTGNIHMGEYRTATFTATRTQNKRPRQKIFVPQGPPLAT